MISGLRFRFRDGEDALFLPLDDGNRGGVLDLRVLVLNSRKPFEICVHGVLPDGVIGCLSPFRVGHETVACGAERCGEIGGRGWCGGNRDAVHGDGEFFGHGRDRFFVQHAAAADHGDAARLERLGHVDVTARKLLSRPAHRKRSERGRASGSEGV